MNPISQAQTSTEKNSEIRSILLEDPFNSMEAYTSEALSWAKQIEQKIDLSALLEKDPLIISTAFAFIFSSFIHFSMAYPLNDFEDYFNDLDYPDDKGSWQKMHECVTEIFSALMKVFKDPYLIYLTLYEAILVEVEDWVEEGGNTKVEPQSYHEEAGFSFVANGFNF